MLPESYRSANPQVCDKLAESLDQVKRVNVCPFSLTQNGDLLSRGDTLLRGEGTYWDSARQSFAHTSNDKGSCRPLASRRSPSSKTYWLKDSAFSEEQEWRALSQMIASNHPQMGTRPAGS